MELAKTCIEHRLKSNSFQVALDVPSFWQQRQTQKEPSPDLQLSQVQTDLQCFALCKVIQDRLGFWSPGFNAVDPGFLFRGTWTRDSSR